MCPLKREQARREMQQWVMRRLPTADSIVEIGRKVGHELITARSCYNSSVSQRANYTLKECLKLVVNCNTNTSSSRTGYLSQ